MDPSATARNFFGAVTKKLLRNGFRGNAYVIFLPFFVSATDNLIVQVSIVLESLNKLCHGTPVSCVAPY